ncbi:MAG: dicarboxylate/amino acid:cation symporter [Spirochaetales bacterium]|nr:dicarboxylate/amino acid:cation symporter [Spirochaetales bacterium]
MSYNAEFPISSEKMGDCLEFIEDSLKNYRLKKRDLMESLLISEEILIQMEEQAPKDALVQIVVNKKMGIPRISFTAPGNVMSLDEQTSGISLDQLGDNTEGTIRNTMLQSFSESIRYRHSKSKNYVTIITGIPERELASQTITAICLSVIIGFFGRFVLPQNVNQFIIDNFFGPVETVFLSGLMLIASPAIFLSITCSILRFDGFGELNRSGKQVIFTYLFTSLIATLTGVLIFNIFKPGTAGMLVSQMGTGSVGVFSILNILTDSIPPNIIEPFTSGNTLQLLVAALLLGLSLNLSNKKVHNLKVLLEELDIVCGKASSIVMKTIPFVVFCSTTSVILRSSLAVYVAITQLILTLIIGLIVMVAIYCIFLIIRIRINPITFLRKYIPVMKDTFLKGSGVAAIPLTMRFCKRQLGIPQKITSFVIPLGATINMDGNCVCLTIISLFFGRICGIQMGMNDLVILIFMILILSLGAPIAPGTIILCMVTLLSQIGISLEGISLIIGLNFILEMILGMINTLGDVVVSLIIAKQENVLNYEVCNKIPPKKQKKACI